MSEAPGLGLAIVHTGLGGGCCQNAHKPAVPTAPGAGLTEPSLQPVGGVGAGPPRGKHGAHFVLSEENLLSDGDLVEAREASEEDLLVVHTRRYLSALKVHGRGCQPAVGQGGGEGPLGLGRTA